MENSNYRWLNEESQQFLERGYLLPGESVAERIEGEGQIADTAFRGNPEKKKKFIEYMQKGYISLSSPVWANFGREDKLSISCFGSFIEDSMNSILETATEIGIMSKYGGGTSLTLSQLRGRGSSISKGGQSEGAISFAQIFDTISLVTKQSQVRRGACAAYMDIEHPDIYEFLDIKHEGNPIQNLFTGVTVTNEWLQKMKDGDQEKRVLWAKVLQSRQRIGLPYIFFTTNNEERKPLIYKERNCTIHNSNLCQEIALPTNEEESFVCCLASLNALYFDEWVNTDVVEILTEFLDHVITNFIRTASQIKHLERAVKFAERHRAIGLGVLGYHSYLQSKGYPFESMEAKFFNVDLFSTIRKRSYTTSEVLAKTYGPAPIFLEGPTEDLKRRNTTTMAVAPTASSSFILGQVSQGIEPYNSNAYMRDTAKGKILQKNPFLIPVLQKYGKDTPETWESIKTNFGSVQHLNFLSSEEKDVFKTFAEISQKEVLIQAAQRQKFIDQGQSINLKIHPKTPTKDVNSLILFAAENGIKGLYYQHSLNAAQAYSNQLTCASCEA